MKKQHISLPSTDRSQLEIIAAKGEQPVRVLKRALGLLALDRGETMTSVAKHLHVSLETVGNWRDKYNQEGLKVLYDEPRPGRPPAIDGLRRAQITALACSEAPEGYAQWSLRLLADKIVELNFCESISHTQVGNILKKTK